MEGANESTELRRHPITVHLQLDKTIVRALYLPTSPFKDLLQQYLHHFNHYHEYQQQQQCGPFSEAGFVRIVKTFPWAKRPVTFTLFFSSDFTLQPLCLVDTQRRLFQKEIFRFGDLFVSQTIITIFLLIFVYKNLPAQPQKILIRQKSFTFQNKG